jgi:hypothetical protein
MDCFETILDFILGVPKCINTQNRGYTVCPQSPFGVLKNCGAQTNWASHMRFAADYSETLEDLYWPQ